MASKRYDKVAKGMREALDKGPAAITKSWLLQRPGAEEFISPGPVLWEKKPDMVRRHVGNTLGDLVEDEILEPKTRYLIIIACYMMINHWGGLMPQMSNAKAAGATEEEIMEVANICCYAVAKDKLTTSWQHISTILESPQFKAIKILKE